MAASNLNSIAEFLLYFELSTLAFSILIMFGGKNIFKKASKKEMTVFYPILNLFTMLEITETSVFLGILFFVPVLNVISICIMFYRLGVVFNTSMIYKIGLVILPIIFYPLLAYSKKQYKVVDEEYFKLLDNVKNENINLMTQSELNELNKNIVEEEQPKVDSIFKSEIKEKAAPEPYKAVKFDILGLNKTNNSQKEVNNTQNNEKVNQSKNEENIEYLDL